MGTHHSSHCHESLQHDISSTCNCFKDDKSVAPRSVVRDLSIEWIWTNGHHSILSKHLTLHFDQFPKSIVDLIKDHCFSTHHAHVLSKTVICEETHHTKTKLLLNKALCTQWFHQYFVQNRPQCLSIAVYDLDGKTSRHVIDYFTNNCFYLPMLQLDSQRTSDRRSSVKRTLLIDDCPVPVHLMKAHGVSAQAHVNMLLLNESSDVREATKIIEMSSKNQSNLLVKVVNTKKKFGRSPHHPDPRDQLCRHYNVASLALSLQSKKSMHDLFVYAIKYHWFCMVQSQ